MTTDKKIEDYLHLYLGCEMVSKSTGEKMGKLLGIVGNEAHFKINGIMYSSHLFNYKPILRPLSDMSEEETQELFYMRGGRKLCDKAKQVLWLLSKNFDLFNLIPEGLAIDKKTLK